MLHNAKNLYTQYQDVVRAYLSMIGGSVGRLVLSLVYFVCIANALSIGEFGLFATASATGIMISRLLAFGFVSPLYRVATVKPRLVGAYTSGFLAGGLLSLPLVAIVCLAVFFAVFQRDMSLSVFATFMVAEIICWRGLEVVIIVLNGLGKFGRGAILVIVGTSIRTLAALVFAVSHMTTLGQWSALYLAANLLCLIVAVVWFFPRVRLRWHPALYARRWVDSLSVAGAEVLFYIQSEFDKIIVLAIGGPVVSGIYAIIMRLADLTALPVRSFNTLLVQKIMRTPKSIDSWRLRSLIEMAVMVVSTAGMAAMALYLWIVPNGLGNNVAQVAPFVLMILLVPAFRNLIEYHSELLYATGLTIRRMVNLMVVGLLKASFLAMLLHSTHDVALWTPWLNGLYFGLYAASFALTYTALQHRADRII